MPGAPVRLRCEYLQDPVGIDTPRPRLSWWPDDDRPAELQTAYQVQAASDPQRLNDGDADLWDTGHVSSQQTLNVEYAGRPLGSAARVWWRVRSYDSDGLVSPWSEPGYFELGLLEPGDWHGVWIGAPLIGSPTVGVPVPLLTRRFDLPAAPVSARLHLAILGAAIVEINGQPVSAAELHPQWTDYRRRVCCVALDVTALLRADTNCLAVLLGDGYYSGHLVDGPRQRFGDAPLLCADLDIRFADGSGMRIGTDACWLWQPSWILRADPFRGESVDGRQQAALWSDPSTVPVGYPVRVADPAPELLRVGARLPPLRIIGHREPAGPPQTRITADGSIRLRYDFGCSLFGRVRLRVKARRGAGIGVRYGVLAPESAAAASGDGLCWHTGQDEYTARGDADGETFEPRFALRAFRFIELHGSIGIRDLLDVSVLEIGTGQPPAAEFDCDHGLLNTLFVNARRTLEQGLAPGAMAGLGAARRAGEIHELPAVLAAASSCLDSAAVHAAWVRDLLDAEQPGGGFPVRVPPIPVPAAAGADFGDRVPGGAFETLPVTVWFLYRCYGDRAVLEQAYPAIQRCLAGLRRRWSALLLDEDGDVPAVAAEHERTDAHAVTDPLARQLIGFGEYAYALMLGTRIAGILGRSNDLEAYAALADRVRRRFRARFVTPDGYLAGDGQLGYLLALQLGLLQGRERALAVERLGEQLTRQWFHPALDLRDGAFLLEVLTREGRLDLAYQTLLQTSAPSWLHPVQQGATLLWDEQRGESGRLAAGSVIGWIQRYLLGMDLDHDLMPDLNAYRRMRIQPHPPLGARFEAGPPLCRAAGFLDTVHGRYHCGWQIDNAAGEFRLQVTVPGNCSARVILPDGAEHRVAAGRHEFSLALRPVAATASGAAERAAADQYSARNPRTAAASPEVTIRADLRAS